MRLELSQRGPAPLETEGFVAIGCAVLATMGQLRALSLGRGMTRQAEDVRRLRRALVVGGASKSLRWLSVECEWGEGSADEGSDEFAEVLASLTNLRGLDASGWLPARNEGRLAVGLGSLRMVKLYNAVLTSTRIAALSSSRRLAALWLEELEYDDAGLRQLIAANGQSLRQITLWNAYAMNAFDEEPLADAILRTAPNLRALALTSAHVGTLTLVGTHARAHLALEAFHIWLEDALEFIVGLSAAMATKALRRLRHVSISAATNSDISEDIEAQLAVSGTLPRTH